MDDHRITDEYELTINVDGVTYDRILGYIDRANAYGRLDEPYDHEDDDDMEEVLSILIDRGLASAEADQGVHVHPMTGVVVSKDVYEEGQRRRRLP